MPTDRTARILGAVLGLVFIQTGASTLPAAVEVGLRVVSPAAFIALIGAWNRWGGREEPLDRTGSRPKNAVGRNYQFIPAAGGAAIVVGILVVNRLLHTPLATGPWIATVVSAHFFVLAALWQRPSLHALGGAMTLCAMAGLALAFGDAPTAAVGVVAGVAPGLLLLGSLWRWSVRARAVPERTTA
ncbi:hypothetical protein ACFU7Y_07915 [Kitasatospora sp. NPDC057542]|uniref:hypothetical protein n=1 Tax=Streptomycetaceae TaxID=2062 RepID=UPI0013E4397E|nr:hypothetical protein [Streptomyces sp. LS1784]QIE08625.1 hypothetical protein [Streptomyces sp.]